MVLILDIDTTVWRNTQSKDEMIRHPFAQYKDLIDAMSRKQEKSSDDLVANLRKWGSLKVGEVPPNNWEPPLTELLNAAADKIETAWQPIETAPKDGSDILLWHGRWNVGGWADHHYDRRHEQEPSWVINGGYVVKPTHWAPLPAPYPLPRNN